MWHFQRKHLTVANKDLDRLKELNLICTEGIQIPTEPIYS